MLALLFFILLLLQLSFIMSLLHVLSSILIVEVGLCKPEGQAMLSGFISLQDLCSFLKKTFVCHYVKIKLFSKCSMKCAHFKLVLEKSGNEMWLI